MEVLPGTVSRPLPGSLVGTYRSLHRFRKEDMASLTLAAYEGRESQEETIRRLTDAGIDIDLAAWYVGEVWRSGAPVAPYSEEGESLERPAPPASTGFDHRFTVLMAGITALMVQVLVIVLSTLPSIVPGKDYPAFGLALTVLLKATQAILVYVLAYVKGKRRVFYTTLSLFLGWFVVLFLLLARPWRFGRGTEQSHIVV